MLQNRKTSLQNIRSKLICVYINPLQSHGTAFCQYIITYNSHLTCDYLLNYCLYWFDHSCDHTPLFPVLRFPDGQLIITTPCTGSEMFCEIKWMISLGKRNHNLLMSTVTIMSYLRLNLTYISLPLRNNVSLGSLNKALQRRWAFDPYIQIL